MLFETFHSLQETLVDFARTHADWLAPLGFAFAFLKSLPLVALVIPGTALLLSIGAILGLGDSGFVPVWLAIAVGAALGDWVQYACGVWFGPSLTQSKPLRKRPELLHRSARFIQKWGVLSIVLCRFFGPLRATVPMIAGICGMRAAAFQVANWASAFLWAAALLLPGWWGTRTFL
ncbi:DedA family protein [Achromobacter dolens]|jgi:membrane protein DedA with SNARE-associated domain|uniref:VTT domain-containing protein n=1 Tax=Achromobacter dolens TaxID=1287738 RepID=A0A6S7BS57_9BURK|nr:DedA family protein [Achromobacter dolens]CAB3674864.1 hypothetical protein LMG26840_03994 [Achromobacter dolens]CAB3815202.1 hypothetical protein LMG26841_00127 [Achromobacter dolens]CAB3864942.1 hypothetical protein LMG26842_03554 [Achromobacter dolens]